MMIPESVTDGNQMEGCETVGMKVSPVKNPFPQIEKVDKQSDASLSMSNPSYF